MMEKAAAPSCYCMGGASIRHTTRIYQTFQAALREAMEQRGAFVCKIKPDELTGCFTLTVSENAAPTPTRLDQ